MGNEGHEPFCSDSQRKRMLAHVECCGMGLCSKAKCGLGNTETRIQVEKHEVVAEFKSNRREREPVQPHEMETHVGDIIASEWSGKEEWCSKRKR